MNDEKNLFIYDEASIRDGRSLLTEIRNDISDLDQQLYDGIMKISYANGFDQVDQENSEIDLRMPEKLLIQCREEVKGITDALNNQTHLINSYLGKEISSDKIESLSTMPEQTDFKDPNTQQNVVKEEEKPDLGVETYVVPGIIGLMTGTSAVIYSNKKMKDSEKEDKEENKK